MKKYFIIILIFLFFGNSAYSEEINNSFIVNPEDVIFRSSLNPIVETVDDTSYEYSDSRDFSTIDPYNMPFFKQIRLKITNKYIEKTSKPKSENTKSKLKFWQKNKQNSESKETESELTGENEEKISLNTTDTLSLAGTINKEVTEKQLMLDAENVNFDDETGDMVATGRPYLEIPPQNMSVIADKITYNDDGNILKAIGNVIVIKEGKPINTDYMEIDLNEESMFMDGAIANFPMMKLKAKKVVQKDGLIVLNEGNLHSDESTVYKISSNMFGPSFQDMMVDTDVESLFFGNPDGNNLNIYMKSIEIDARKNHDVIKMKGIKAARKDKIFFKWPSLTAYTNKEHDYFEGNYPEFGSRRKLGMYAGPGFVFGGPMGSVIKVIPFVNYLNSKIGVGGMMKYVNKYNRTELGYTSADSVFILKGKQKLDDNLYLNYAYNSYSDEWFLGGRMPKYIAELYYDKNHVKPNFLSKNLDLTFRHRISFGFMKDDDRNYNSETFNSSGNMSTTRTRYMAEITQSFYNYKNEEKKYLVDAGVVMQGSAALYGTGDTQFIARLGPRLRIQYKNWMQDVGYFLTGYHDESPLPRFDAYRFGSSSIYINEALRLHKYLSIGWAGYINVSHDSPNGKLFQGNAFLVSVGPDDFKIVFGYDFIRETTYFGFNLAFDPKGTNLNYDKMIIKNPEKLGKHEESEKQVAYKAPKTIQQTTPEYNGLYNKQNVSKPQVLQYAEVIEIEDPDKERID